MSSGYTFNRGSISCNKYGFPSETIQRFCGGTRCMPSIFDPINRPIAYFAQSTHIQHKGSSVDFFDDQKQVIPHAISDNCTYHDSEIVTIRDFIKLNKYIFVPGGHSSSMEILTAFECFARYGVMIKGFFTDKIARGIITEQTIPRGIQAVHMNHLYKPNTFAVPILRQTTRDHDTNILLFKATKVTVKNGITTVSGVSTLSDYGDGTSEGWKDKYQYNYSKILRKIPCFYGSGGSVSINSSKRISERNIEVSWTVTNVNRSIRDMNASNQMVRFIVVPITNHNRKSAHPLRTHVSRRIVFVNTSDGVFMGFVNRTSGETAFVTLENSTGEHEFSIEQLIVTDEDIECKSLIQRRKRKRCKISKHENYYLIQVSRVLYETALDYKLCSNDSDLSGNKDELIELMIS